MIIRVFRARVQPGKEVVFERLLREDAVPLMLSQAGLSALHVGGPMPVEGTPREFVMVSVWDNLASLKAFAGDNWHEAVVLPGEAELLEKTFVDHYDGLGDIPQVIPATDSDSCANF